MEEEIGALLSRANLARVRGNLEEAQTICQSALELCPSSAEAHGVLGDLFATQGKHDEALHCYSRAVELKPQSASLLQKRDRAIQERHARLLSSQQQAQKPAPPAASVAVPTKAPKKLVLPERSRWLWVGLLVLGGIVMLLLGIWLGTVVAPRDELVPTKVPATVGRRS